MYNQIKTFITSDPHFGHEGQCIFDGADGKKSRPWDNVEAMNQGLVERWNDTVRPHDRVICLGDFAWNRRSLYFLHHLHGRKHLVMGNHDLFMTDDYLYTERDENGVLFQNPHRFEKLHGAMPLDYGEDKIILTHIPVHPSTIRPRFKYNIHGHLHTYSIRTHTGAPDFRYINACVEHTDFRPIELHELIDRHEQQQKDFYSRCKAVLRMAAPYT